jgi:hypothetical protein
LDEIAVGHKDDRVSFFDEFPLLPPSPESSRWPSVWEGPPAGWIGGWVPWRIVLFRSGDIHVTLREFEAFPTGLRFSLVTQMRVDPENEAPQKWESGRHPFSFGRGEGLRLGVIFADGRRTVVDEGVPLSTFLPGSAGESYREVAKGDDRVLVQISSRTRRHNHPRIPIGRSRY